MRIFNTDFSKRTVRRLAGPALSLAGLALMTAPSEAQATDGGSESCTDDSQCDDYNWDTENWCHQGSCKTVRRHKQSCKVQPKQNCWSDYACQDGNPNTVNWCEFDGFDWFNWWKPGKCYSAPRDGSGCVGGGDPTQCTRNRDCRDGDRNTRDWCFEGSCFHIDKNSEACLEDGSYCLGNRHCSDGDRNTVDWCYRGECYHAPKDGGGSCEPGQGCDPADCPDDGNDCTQADCVGDSCAQINVDDGTACNNNSGVCSDGVCQVCDPDQCPEDDNPCTFAACLFGACAQSEVDNGTSCGDEKVCQDGLCTDVVCNPANCPNDSNECTVPACDQDGECALNPVDDNTSCDGGNGSCQAGVCQPNFVCDPATCPADGNECTEAACENNACVQANVQNGTCNNGNGVCDQGNCVECVEDSQCDDSNECTSGSCSSNGVCEYTPVGNGASCNAGAGVCISGNCAAVCNPANCPDDGNECTESFCQADNSCGTRPVSAGSSCAGGAGSCDDNGTCDVCMPSDCADSNECTQASCNGATCENNNVQDGTSCNNNQGVCQAGACVGCIDDSQCTDGNACNGAETCVNSVCQAGTAVECAQVECQAGSCDPTDGSCSYTNLADGALCANGSGTCTAGSCNVCEVSNCDDQNECTIDSCDGPNCSNVNVDDGTSCANGSGTCQNGTCDVCEDSECDDQNDCTVDACQGAVCTNTPVGDGNSCGNDGGVCSGTSCVECINDTGCDDGSACNGAETCVNNSCQAGTTVECAPVECQVGVCNEPSGDCGYTNLADGSSCSDGAGQCFGGQCTVCQPSDCEDETNECTAARCNETNQCVDEPVTDGTPCTGGQCNSGQCVECVADSDCAAATNCTEAATCVNNSCQAGAPVVCPDDGNVCTAHACDPATGCVTSNVADGTSCGTNGETCQAGVCQTPVLCDPIEVTVYTTRRGAVNNPTAIFSNNDWKVRGNGYQIRYVNADPTTRAYWCWDLDNIDGTVLSAEFSATHSSNSYESIDTEEVVSLNELVEPCDARLDAEFDVSPKPAFNQSFFNDAGDGASYGTFTATAASVNTTEVVTLNAAGIAGIQNAIDNNQPFGMGGSLVNTRPGGFERVFKGTTGDNPPKFTKLNLVIRPNTCATTETLQPVDLGHWIRFYQESTQTDLLTYRYQNPSPALRPEHQNYPTGRQIQPGGRIGEGRAYFIFDVGGVSDAKAAKLRLWVSQRQPGFNEFGAYNSIDPSETVVLREFSGYTPAQILDTTALPYRDNFNHTNDRPVFDAMGVGEFYSDRVFTQSDEETNLIPNPNAPAGTVCNDFLAAIPCGKWVEFPLNDAGLAALNANNGQWMFSMSMVSFSPSNTVGASGWESTMHGTVVDLSPGAGPNLYPAYKAPEPQLVITRF